MNLKRSKPVFITWRHFFILLVSLSSCCHLFCTWVSAVMLLESPCLRCVLQYYYSRHCVLLYYSSFSEQFLQREEQLWSRSGSGNIICILFSMLNHFYSLPTVTGQIQVKCIRWIVLALTDLSIITVGQQPIGLTPGLQIYVTFFIFCWLYLMADS